MNLSLCVQSLTPGSVNHRREIYDLLDGDFPEAGHVNIFRFKKTEAPNVGGNHWHADDEIFFIAAGEMTKLVLEHIDTKERMTWFRLGPGTRIMIPGRVAHANILREDLILVGALRHAVDPADVHPYPLLNASGNEINSGV